MRSRSVALIVGLGAALTACGILQSYDGYTDGVRPVDEGGSTDGPSGDSAADGNVTSDGASDGATDAGADGDAAISPNAAIYFYAIGGRVRSGGVLSPTNDVAFLRVYLDGGLDPTWSSAPALPNPTSNHGTVTSGDAVVVLGGTVGNVATGAVYSARATAGTGLTSWVTQPFPIPTPRSDALVASVPGYVYALGLGGTGVSYATLSNTGDVGSWTTTTVLPVIHGGGAFCAAGSGYVYLLGGESQLTRIDYAKIMPGGSLGAWTSSALALPVGLSEARAFVADGRLYVLGGYAQGSGTTTAIIYASIAADGSLNSWTTSTNPIPGKRAEHGLAYFPLLKVLILSGGTVQDNVEVPDLRSSGVTATGELKPWSLFPLLPNSRTQHTNAILLK